MFIFFSDFYFSVLWILFICFSVMNNRYQRRAEVYIRGKGANPIFSHLVKCKIVWEYRIKDGNFLGSFYCFSYKFCQINVHTLQIKYKQKNFIVNLINDFKFNLSKDSIFLIHAAEAAFTPLISFNQLQVLSATHWHQ